jgi:DNA helicase-4
MKPYFRHLEKSFKQLRLLDDSFFEKTQNLYVQIKTNKKQQRLAMTYDVLWKKLDAHNSDVEAINQELLGFNYSDILSNPIIHPPTEFNKYNSVLKKIREYVVINQRYIEFTNQVKSLQKDYGVIIEQYLINREIETVFSQNHDLFLDGRKVSGLRKELKTISERLDKYETKYYDFQQLYNLDNYVKDYNEKYIIDRLDDPIFTLKDNKTYDINQRKAILSDDVSTLVIAGAGCGKTFTILGKVRYLIERLGIKETDILLMSFSRNSADDLEEKVKEISEFIPVDTFHAVGLRILENAKHQKFMIEEQYQAIIESFFRDELVNRPRAMQRILTYYALYLSSANDKKTYEDEGELYEDLKNSDFTTLRDRLLNLSNDISSRETLKRELVKSYEEMAIANYYFINGIKYIYESPYIVEFTTAHNRQYMPDFYLPDANIYHEHYGINADGKATQFTKEENAKYVEGVAWKRDVHRQNRTVCIETYSYEFSRGFVFDELEKRLTAHGVKFNPISSDGIKDTLKGIYDGQDFKSLINLISTFLCLYKSKYRDSASFETLKNNAFPSEYEKRRAGLFLDICKEVYEFYISAVKGNDKIDFDDMILDSVEHLDKINDFKYKYIIVDEFQDISFSRLRFLQKLISHGQSKLFAVGDDWQSIYRFAGCDVDIILKFSNHFEFSGIHYVTTTYRNSQELQNIAEPFITANPKQLQKHILSSKALDKPIKIMFFNEDKPTAFCQILKQIYAIDERAEILVLGRNNHDVNTILSADVWLTKDKIIKSREFPLFRMEYKTVHGSKGLQSQFVIIINADDSRYGFPNKLEDDCLLSLVLSDRDSFIFSEERRLFYVAITRTKSYVFILVSQNRPSSFVKEIEKECSIMNLQRTFVNNAPVYCPRCKSGQMILRDGPNKRRFFGCSNYPYCTYTINDLQAVRENRRCPLCGGFMVYRKGRYGSFYGCSNYNTASKQGCTYTIEYGRLKQ